MYNLGAGRFWGKQQMESTTPTLSSVSSVRSGDRDHEIVLITMIMIMLIPDRKVDGEHWQWKETARWVKFEEDVEEVSSLLRASKSKSMYIIIIKKATVVNNHGDDIYMLFDMIKK